MLKMAGENRLPEAKAEFAQLIPAKMEEDSGAKIGVRVRQATVDIYPGADLEMVAALYMVLCPVE